MVDQNSKEVYDMVLAAKNGDWGTVNSVLSSNPNFINCIPEDRSWAALHQAVYWNNKGEVEKLLQYNTCDSEVKTKEGFNESGPGKTSLWLAQNLSGATKRAPLVSLLESNMKNERRKRFGGTIPTYVTVKDGADMDKKGLPLLLLTLSNYKKTFHPDNVDPNTVFTTLMQQVFDSTGGEGHWQQAKDKMSSSMKAFDVAAGDFLSKDKSDPKTTPKQRFYARIVKLYSKNSVYREANESLRREGQMPWKPTGDDLAIAPFTLMLDVLLFYWNELERVTSATYRGATLKQSDIAMYSKGTQFVWLNFVSSSMDESVARGFAGNTLFEITNNTESLWQPRKLSHAYHDLHDYAHEKEALYPAGAEFKVTSVDTSGSLTVIKLNLMNPA